MFDLESPPETSFTDTVALQKMSKIIDEEIVRVSELHCPSSTCDNGAGFPDIFPSLLGEAFHFVYNSPETCTYRKL